MRLFLLLLLTLFMCQTWAGEIIIQNGLNGYNGCRDTHLSEPGMGSDGPHGSSPSLIINTGSWVGCIDQVIAISFKNIDSILGNYTIKEVFLELFFEEMVNEDKKEITTELDLKLFRSLTKWDEDVATWKNASSSTKWKTPAGDYNKYCFSRFQAEGDIDSIWHKFDISTMKNIDPKTYKTTWISPIEQMIEKPEENYGFLLYAFTIPEFKYTSSQNEIINRRPRLRVIVEESVGITNINNSPKRLAINNNEKLKQLTINSTKADNLFVVLYKANGVLYPVKLEQHGKNVVYSYKNLSAGVYFLNCHNKETNHNEVVKLVTF